MIPVGLDWSGVRPFLGCSSGSRRRQWLLASFRPLERFQGIFAAFLSRFEASQSQWLFFFLDPQAQKISGISL
jgi:hypothetical protein